MKHTLLTERFQQLAGIRPLYQIEEGTLSDLKDKIKPTLSKIFSTGKSKSKEVYDIVKKEFNDEGNQEKAKAAALAALDASSKAYKFILKTAEKGVTDDNLKKISNILPSLRLTGLGTAIGVIYQMVAGASGPDTTFFGLVPTSSPTLGDPSTAIYIGTILVSLKLVIYALQAIARTRKGVGAVKSMFKEDEDVMGDVEFNDIESIFELNSGAFSR